jgi:hypothetical protein
MWGGLYAGQFIDRSSGGHKARPTVPDPLILED